MQQNEREDVVLEVRNLKTEFFKGRERNIAVQGVSFNLHRHQTIGIVGESGSGKSVTSLTVMGLLPSSGKAIEGEIIYHGRTGSTDLLKLPEKFMRAYRGRDIAMIFQEPMTSLNPVYTCGNQVMEAIRRHLKLGKKEAKAKTLQLFEGVRLPDPMRIFKSYPHQLSGGQKQRVLIAMALSCDPAILIADEPTTALDVSVQKHILEVLRDLQKRHGMGMMFITHDLGVIAELADYVMVMYQGEVVEQGTVHQIFTNPQHAYTKGLLACRPPLDRKLSKLPTIGDFMKKEENGTITEMPIGVAEVIDLLTLSDSKKRRRIEGLYGKEPIVQVRGLETTFYSRKKGKTVKAVDGVSFDIYPGETLGLVGESGCGKTTLGRTLLKLVEPAAGQILFDGEDITGYNAHDMRRFRRDMQIVFQDPYSSLNPRITIGSAIIEPMKVHGVGKSARERKDFAMDLLGKVGLKQEHFYRYPHEFSGGQRQRISIARTLAVNPRFIVCDESVSALDVSVQAQVLNLLIDLRSEFDLTYIFISHDLSVVRFISDRMMVMNQGKIEEMGLSDDIYAQPKTDYTRMLIDAIPRGEVQKKNPPLVSA
jgi:peptide/nickel transport system ATP-binding protein